MVSLEEKLTPPHVEQPWARDTLGLGLLIALAAVFYPFWQVSPWRYITDVAGQMASPHLLPALGFCLALRCGAIDLSVWASASLGGLVAGGLINAGAPPGLALAAACAAGLAPGAINAALVSFARLPSPIVTLAVALTSM
ncbi:MAG: ABC transporter permease subunit, partial [Planctomycetota bacterium]